MSSNLQIVSTSVYTTKNTVISPNFLVWKFYGKEQFPHSFGRFAKNYAETVAFHKISTPAKLCEITIFFAVVLSVFSQSQSQVATMEFRTPAILD